MQVADAIAAEVGLLTAQTFLVGLMAVRLDRSYDSAVSRIRELGGRLRDDGRVSVEEVLDEIEDCREQARQEVSARATLAAVAGVLALSVVVGVLGTGQQKATLATDTLTRHWTRWEQGPTSVAALLTAIAGLAMLAVYRAGQSRRRLNRALQESGLADAAEVWELLTDLQDPSRRRPFAADRVQFALRHLTGLLPDW